MKNRLVLKIVFLLLATLSISAATAQEMLDAKKATIIGQIAKGYASEKGFSGSILIGQGDEIFYESSHGLANYDYKIPNTSSTKFRLASLSKQFTAAALILLEQQGKVDFEKPISTYLGTLKPEIGEKISIHHILSHSSGLGRDIESLSKKDLGKGYISLPAIISLINKSSLFFEPGEKMSYSNQGYALAAAIIESVTELSYGQAMNELIFKPLDMKDTGHETSSMLMPNRAKGYISLPDDIINAAYEDKSYVIGAGSIYSTTHDLFLWGRELLSGNLISKENKDRLFSRQAGRYGYGWYIDTYVWFPVNDENQALNPHHDGGSPGFEANMSLLTKHNMVVIILSNKLPSHLNGLSNRITNVSLGFEESLPKADGSHQLFTTLFERGVPAAQALVKEWMASGKKYMLPSSGDILLVGRGYMDSNIHEKAILTMDFLIKVRPSWTYPYLFKGIIMEKLGKTQEAIEQYEKVLQINPKQSNAAGRMSMLKKQN